MRILPIIGTHAFYVLEGEEISSETVSKDWKPSNDPASNWHGLGVVEENDLDPQYEGETTHYMPAPGGYVPRKSTYEAMTLQGQLLLQDMDELVMALTFGAKMPDAEGDFIPGSAREKMRGWLKLQKYLAEDDQLVTIVDMWCELWLGSGIQHSRTPSKATIAFRMLQSPLNVGKLSNLTAGGGD